MTTHALGWEETYHAVRLAHTLLNNPKIAPLIIALYEQANERQTPPEQVLIELLVKKNGESHEIT